MPTNTKSLPAPLRELSEDPSGADSRAGAAPRMMPTLCRALRPWFGIGMGHPVSLRPSTRSPRSHRESTAPQARDAAGDARTSLAADRETAGESRLAASFSSAEAFRSG